MERFKDVLIGSLLVVSIALYWTVGPSTDNFPVQEEEVVVIDTACCQHDEIEVPTTVRNIEVDTNAWWYDSPEKEISTTVNEDTLPYLEVLYVIDASCENTFELALITEEVNKDYAGTGIRFKYKGYVNCPKDNGPNFKKIIRMHHNFDADIVVYVNSRHQGETIGLAVVGGYRRGYNMIVADLEDPRTIAQQGFLISHEIGHLFGLTHTRKGIMKERVGKGDEKFTGKQVRFLKNLNI